MTNAYAQSSDEMMAILEIANGLYESPYYEKIDQSIMRDAFLYGSWDAKEETSNDFRYNPSGERIILPKQIEVYERSKVPDKVDYSGRFPHGALF